MASNPPAQPGPAIGRPELVKTALEVAEKAKGAPYTWGGHSTAGFDCSGFVIYSLRQAYPNGGWSYMTANQIFGSSRFEAVGGPPRPGDLIGWRQGGRVTHDHVGIVVSDTQWIGSQSTGGVRPVVLSNPYWASRHPFFLRLK